MLMGMLGDAYTIFDKEMKIWWKTPFQSIGRAFLMPVMWLVIFGSAFGGTASNVPVALVMEDNGHYAQLFVQDLTEGNIVKVAANTNYQHALDMLDNKQVSAIVFIPPGFSDSVASGKQPSIKVDMDTTVPVLSGGVSGALAQARQLFANQVLAERAAGNAGAGSASGAGAVVGGAPAVATLDVQQNILYGRGMRYIDFMAAGVVVQVMVFSALFAGGMGLILDRELGTLKMLMSAPIDKMAIVLGKVTSGVVQALVSGGIALIIALMIGVQIKTGLLGLVLVFFILTLVAFGFIGMTVALAARIRSLESFAIAVQSIVMPVWFLSGSLYPIETVPGWMKPLTLLNPLTYATEAVRSLMIRGVIWQTLAFDVLVLVVFAVIMLAIGARTFKRTLE